METRRVALRELRAADAAHPRRLRGTAIVYGAEYDLGEFVERIQPGAVKATLADDGINIRARFEHRELLASVNNGTLRITDTPEGLDVEFDVAETRAGDDVLALVGRGDIEGMSFGFNVVRQTWTEEGDTLYRDIHELKLWEVTVTDSPAYTATTIAMRSVDPAAIAEAQRRHQAGSTPAERARRLRLLASA